MEYLKSSNRKFFITLLLFICWCGRDKKIEPPSVDIKVVKTYPEQGQEFVDQETSIEVSTTETVDISFVDFYVRGPEGDVQGDVFVRPTTLVVFKPREPLMKRASYYVRFGIRNTNLIYAFSFSTGPKTGFQISATSNVEGGKPCGKLSFPEGKSELYATFATSATLCATPEFTEGVTKCKRPELFPTHEKYQEFATSLTCEACNFVENATITVLLTGEIDPTIMDEETVKLMKKDVQRGDKPHPIQVGWNMTSREIIIQPITSLQSQTEYYIRVTGLFNLYSNPIPEFTCYFMTRDFTPPQISESIPPWYPALCYPQPGSMSYVWIKFDERMDKNTLNTETIRVAYVAENGELKEKLGKIEYNPKDYPTEASFIFLNSSGEPEPISSGTYYIFLTSEIKDISGNPISSRYTKQLWCFKIP